MIPTFVKCQKLINTRIKLGTIVSFDDISYEMLLNKLEKYGFFRFVIKFFQYYLMA